MVIALEALHHLLSNISFEIMHRRLLLNLKYDLDKQEAQKEVKKQEYQ
jgi:hypothetical protein